jgi:hypothetical protein
LLDKKDPLLDDKSLDKIFLELFIDTEFDVFRLIANA